MTENPMNMKYRADIDGLRAVAVLSVLFYHAGLPGFSGGFVGVDIFFVISGYLITSIIIKEIDAGHFSVARFYERRIRRIFPALFPVLAFVVVVSAYLFDAAAFDDLGKSVVATTLFSSNMLFWYQAGYFSAPSMQKPLLHTWSLAVEEQFYIFYPLALVVISRYLKKRYVFWLLIAAFLSFGASVYSVLYHRDAAFYFVPTRAWELLAGALLVFDLLPHPEKKWQTSLLSLTGFALIVSSVVVYTEATPFPGFSAALPVFGAVMIIHAGNREGAYVNNMLAVRPMVFVGLVSYSLYLWHWPLVAFARYMTFKPWNVSTALAIVATSLFLATLSWKFIEQPFRGRKPVLEQRGRLFAVSGLVMAVAVGIGGIIQLRSGMPERISRFYPEMSGEIERTRRDTVWKKYGKWIDDTDRYGEDVVPMLVGKHEQLPSFALVGDSHAQALIPAVEKQAVTRGLSGYVITKGGVVCLQGVQRVGKPFDSAAYNKHVLEFIARHREVKTIMLVGRWSYNLFGTYRQEDPELPVLRDTSRQLPDNSRNSVVFKAGLSRTVDALLGMGKTVVLVSDVPEIGYDVPLAYFKHVRWPGISGIDEIRPTIAEYHERQSEADGILEQLSERRGVMLIRPEKQMFDEKGRVRVVENGKLLYLDDDHLSVAGAIYVSPAFDDLFVKIAEGSHVAGLVEHGKDK
jgi:peptidoglycan/LPS O-acetylase OafA/YrhL